jgi:hypothetical protein
MSDKPVFEHDWSDCVFIETIDFDGKTFDIYRHDGADDEYGPSWVARFGNRIGSVHSMPESTLLTLTEEQEKLVSPLTLELREMARAYVKAQEE